MRGGARRANVMAGRQFSLEEALTFSGERAAELVALDDALLALAKFDARKVRIIELRYFGGLSLEETAEALGLSVSTIGHEMRVGARVATPRNRNLKPAMSPERWHRIEELFRTVVDRPVC